MGVYNAGEGTKMPQRKLKVDDRQAVAKWLCELNWPNQVINVPLLFSYLESNDLLLATLLGAPKI